MKKNIERRNRIKIERQFPLADLLDGWFFRCEEISAGRWQVEGVDLWGRAVSATESDPERLIERCVADAEAIKGKPPS